MSLDAAPTPPAWNSRENEALRFLGESRSWLAKYNHSKEDGLEALALCALPLANLGQLQGSVTGAVHRRQYAGP